MITELGGIAKVLKVGEKVKLGTVGDGGNSVWFAVFETESTPELNSIINIKKFKLESVPRKRGETKEYPVLLRITEWDIVE